MALSKKVPEEVKYPHQPLIEVDSEIRFYGEPVVESKRHEFYEAVRDIYPLVFVPPIQAGTHPSLQHYRFETEDATAGATLALNSFGYFQRDYQGAKNYINELLRLFNIANGLFNIKNFSRVGWRYINAIPYTRENQLIPLANYFEQPPRFFSIESHSYSRINFSATTQYEDKSISVRLESDESLGTGKEMLIFDIDVYKDSLKEIGFKGGGIPSLINELHCIGRNCFEDSITEKYRSFLKGDIYE